MELVLYFVEAALSICEKGSTDKMLLWSNIIEMYEKPWIVFNQLQQLHGDLATGFQAESSRRVHTGTLERYIPKPRVSVCVCEGAADTDI